MYLHKSFDLYSIEQLKRDFNGKFWMSCEEEKLDVACGCAAVKSAVKIKKGLREKGEEIYNIGANRVEVLDKKVYNTDIFKFV